MSGIMIEINPDDEAHRNFVVMRGTSGVDLAAFGPVLADDVQIVSDAIEREYPACLITAVPLRAVQSPALGDRGDDAPTLPGALTLPGMVSELIAVFGRAAVMAEVGEQCGAQLVLEQDAKVDEGTEDDPGTFAVSGGLTTADDTVFQMEGEKRDRLPMPPVLNAWSCVTDVYGDSWTYASDPWQWSRSRDGFQLHWGALLPTFGPVAIKPNPNAPGTTADASTELRPQWYPASPQPPARRMLLENINDQRIVWTGKRWYDPDDSNGSIQTQEAWPPGVTEYGDGPWWAANEFPEVPADPLAFTGPESEDRDNPFT